MTRFEKEISGMLGQYWVQSAKKELDQVQRDFNQGNIKVDEDGVLRNSIGRVAVEEVCEKCKYLGIAFDETATEAARRTYAAVAMAKYKEAHKKALDEDIYEMRAAFGGGAVVVDIITGQKYNL